MTRVLRMLVASAWVIGLAVSVAAQSGKNIDVTGDWDFTVETSRAPATRPFRSSRMASD